MRLPLQGWVFGVVFCCIAPLHAQTEISSTAPASGDDDFSAPQLAAPWEWASAPRSATWSLDENPGHLRLQAVKPRPVSVEAKLDPAELTKVVQLIQSFLNPNDFFRTENVLTRPLLGPGSGEIAVRVEIGGMAEGQIAGLALFREKKYVATLGVVRRSGMRKVQFANTLTRANDAGPEMSAGAVWLRTSIRTSPLSPSKRDTPPPVATFSYSFDGRNFTPIGDTFRLGNGETDTTRIGLFTWSGEKEGGYADFGPFRYISYGSGRSEVDPSATPNFLP